MDNPQQQGYTREVHASSPLFDLHLFIRPEADLEGVVKAYDADMGAWVRINAWMFSIDDVLPSTGGAQ